MSSTVGEADYLDQLSRIVPWHRSLTFYERLLIVFLVSTFVSLVGCILLCLVCSRSRSKRRYAMKSKVGTELCMKESLASSAPPSYEAAVRAGDASGLDRPSRQRFFKSSRQSSYGTASESDGIQSNHDGDHFHYIPNEKIRYSRSTRSSASNNDTPSTATNGYSSLAPTQICMELDFDPTNNLLTLHLTNAEHISPHPAFDEQAEFFIHVQLLPNRTLKKFRDACGKHRLNLPFSLWKKQQEKTTKKLSRTSDDQLVCDERLSFQLSKDDLSSSSLRCLLFCVDRSGAQDLLFESVVPLNSTLVQQHQRLIEFKDLPQIAFAEIYLGIRYLPTAERLTIKVNKLRYLFKIQKDDKIDARLIATFFHRGRRFCHNKLSPLVFDGSLSANHNLHEITETITQNIPQQDILSIYVHFELTLHLLNSKEQSVIPCGTFLLGEHTRYASAWQTMLEQPRQTHLGWYQFFA